MTFVVRTTENVPAVLALSRFLKGHHGFIAGGAFKNILAGAPVRDVDLFFRSATDWEKAHRKFSKSSRYVEGYSNEKVASFIEETTGIRVELIRYRWGTPEEVIGEFDFTVTKFAMDRADEGFALTHHADFFEHLFMHRLVIDDVLVKPISTFERAFKYRGYGFRLCRESKAKLLAAIQSLGVLDDEALSASLYDGID